MAQLRRVKKAATIAGTFAFALSIGYVMQYGDADASRFSGTTPLLQRTVLPAQLDASPLQPAVAMQAKVPAPIQLNDNPLDAIRIDEGSVKLTALVAEAAQEAIAENAALVSPAKQAASECDVEVASALGPQASVILSVRSQCRPEMSFEIHHSGLVFSGLTDSNGQASVTVPALTTNASIFVTFDDGGGAAVSAVVPEADEFHRVILQWEGKEKELIQQTAVEAGALTQIARLGVVTGDRDHFAEVVTFPVSMPAGDALEALTVQAPISDDTCGQPFLAETFHAVPDAAPDFKDIRITLPDCEHVGTFLELKKVLGGQTLLPR